MTNSEIVCKTVLATLNNKLGEDMMHQLHNPEYGMDFGQYIKQTIEEEYGFLDGQDLTTKDLEYISFRLTNITLNLLRTWLNSN